jgi:hypothetical protein
MILEWIVRPVLKVHMFSTYCGYHTVKICRQLRKENICYHRRPVIAEDSRRRKILQDLGRKGNMHFSQGIAISVG